MHVDLKNEWWCNDEVNACGIKRRKAEIVKGRHGNVFCKREDGV